MGDSTICPAQDGPFTPASVSNLQLWLEADNLSLSDGELISSWSDQSGNGFALTQAMSTRQPTYQADILNGHPVVRFTPTGTPGDFLSMESNYLFSANDGITIMALLRSNVEDDAKDYFLDFGAATATGYGFGYSANTDGTGLNMRLYTAGNFGGVMDERTVQKTTSEYVLLTARVQFAPAAGKHQAIYVDGGFFSANATLTLTQLTTAEITESSTRGGSVGPVIIGGQSKTINQTGRFFDGDIALVLMFDRALTETERQSLECYASLKYGISVSQTCI